MKISVIIPSYKPSAYLNKCLESFSKQTMSVADFEILLVLNGPRNPYEEYINDIASEYGIQNLRFIYSEQAGVSKARNKALDIAEGEYITFADDDDYVSNSFLEELYKVASPSTVALSNVKGFIDGTMEPRHFRIEDAYNILCDKGYVSTINARKYFSGPWMKLIHRSIINSRRFNSRFRNGEDSLFMFEISDKISKSKCASSNAIYYRRFRENSAMSSQTPAMIIKNRLLMLVEYSRIYMRNPFKYNLLFFITRILALCHTIIREGILRKGEK